MSNINSRKIWWAIAILYIVLNYATLGIMPLIWERLNSFFGGRGVMLQYIIYLFIGLYVLIYLLFVKKERAPVKYMLFFFFIFIFFLMVRFEKNPGEKIHMGQYGLLGILLYNALKMDFDKFKNTLYVYGSAACIIAGAFDEIIQWFLPNRFFTWHDVFINGLSGVISLLIIRFNILRG
jgi:VanZ family protein